MAGCITDYNKLAHKLRELQALLGIKTLLEWDQIVMLPEGAADSRAVQNEALAGIMHDKKSDPELRALLELLSQHASELDLVQNAVVRDALKDVTRATAMSKELTQRIARLESEGYSAWLKAKEENNFKLFAPVMKEWFAALREKAHSIDPNQPVYDVLLDEWEKGMTTARVDEVLGKVRDGLVPLIHELRTAGGKLDNAWLRGEFPVQAQMELCSAIAKDLGFDMSHGRLDVSAHPMTLGLHPRDVRITTRYKAEDLAEGLTGTIHEVGHGMYEQGRNMSAEYESLPVNLPMSMGLHESQSLLYERMVALSEPFARYLLPHLVEKFPGHFSGRQPEELHQALNVMKDPSMIRTESDEVTYSMHIILRYEIEKALFDGTLEVDDVPGVWNDKMEAYLGHRPATDTEGCLQDVHWASGYTAYFPTYTLGAMYACQIFKFAEGQIPGLAEQIASGNFAALKQLLHDKVHQAGSLYGSADELLQEVTGSPLDPDVFLTYLRDKYSKLYKLGANAV